MSAVRTAILVVLLLLGAESVLSQTSAVGGRVIDRETGETLAGANISFPALQLGAATSAEGTYEITGVPAGTHQLRAAMVGYSEAETTIVLAGGETLVLTIALGASHAEVGEVVITGTRTVRSIADVPVRVEAIPEEEVEEKLLMTPSSVAMLLNESTGMRMQTTSATSNTANLRIQGLNGRYTQLLVDGIPGFSGLSSGFSITQLPPLNLRQVEVIKGATSALYGPDAISGVVNFLTKDPHPERMELSALVNTTTQHGLDVASYHSRSLSDGLGYTVFASVNRQRRFDVDGDGFADIAGYDRASISPKLLFDLGEGVRARLSVGHLTEDRIGGDANAPGAAAGSASPYIEEVKTRRWEGAATVGFAVDGEEALTVKLAGVQMDRDALYGGVRFDATQQLFYADAQFSLPLTGSHAVLVGGAFNLERFDDRTPAGGSSRSYAHNATGFFAQDEWKLHARWTLLASGRLDLLNEFGAFVTPRASLLFRPTERVTLRLGGGTGFKSPTIFVEEAEELGFHRVRPLAGAEPERASSASVDLNWSTILADEVTLGLNVAAYATRISHPLTVDEDTLAATGAVLIRNASGPTFARGGELSAKFGYQDFKLSLGYTFVYATEEDQGETAEAPLNPRHSLGIVLFYESEELGLKTGFETYWTGAQRLERNPFRTQSPSYVVSGLIAEKAFGQIRLFVNFENIFDARQTRWDPIVLGPDGFGGIRTVPIYAPLEGRVVNGGVRFVY